MTEFTDFSHRSVTLLNVPAYLAARSIDPVEFFRLADVPLSYFSNVDSFIPREVCFALEKRLEAMTGDGLLGGHVAGAYHISELGPWGSAISNARTLREALSFAVSQIHLLQTGFTLSAFRDGDSLLIVFRYEGRSSIHPTHHLLGSAVVVRKIALLVGVPEAVEVWLQRPYSAELSNVDEMLGSRIRFDASHNGVKIDFGLIDNPLVGRERQIRASVQTARDVTSHIRQLLPYKRVTRDYVSSLLGTSSRTVQRRLAEWGLSFEQLIDDVRRLEATRLVNETELTIADIAGLVGYSDAPHLMRAFKRWTGMTPVSFRKAATQGRLGMDGAILPS